MAGKFKLQAVLNYRQSLENQAQQVLSLSLQEQVRMQNEIEGFRQQLQNHDDQLRIRQQEGMTVAEMELFEAGIQHCRQQIHQLQQRQLELDRRIKDERNALLKAARERQVMEKLKDKQEAEYRRELDRKERDMLDEISLRLKGERS